MCSLADLAALPRTASPPPWVGEGEGLVAGLGQGANLTSAFAGSGGSRLSRSSGEASDGADSAGYARRLASLLRPSGELGNARCPLTRSLIVLRSLSGRPEPDAHK